MLRWLGRGQALHESMQAREQASVGATEMMRQWRSFLARIEMLENGPGQGRWRHRPVPMTAPGRSALWPLGVRLGSRWLQQAMDFG